MEKHPLLTANSAILQGVIAYQKAVRNYNLQAAYKPPITLSPRYTRTIPAGRKTNIILLPGFDSSGHEWVLFKEVLKPMARTVIEAKVNVALGNEDLTDDLYQWLNAQELLSKSVPLTLLGYSNGGLISRRLLQKYGPLNIRRLIMIATPNWGTSLAVYGQWFNNHEGLKNLEVGSAFLTNLNKDCTVLKHISHCVIVGDAAQNLEGKHYDGVVWEDSATLGYTLPYVRVETGEALRLYPPNSAWHLNLTCRAWRPLGPSNDKAWPITLRYIRSLLAE